MNTFGNAGVTSLQAYQKSFKLKDQLFPAKSHIALLDEEKQPMEKLLLGTIVDLISGHDGQVRGARVLLGESRNTVDRPVNRLYSMETNLRFVLKDPEQRICRPKWEDVELAKVRMSYAPVINWRGSTVKYSDTYLM